MKEHELRQVAKCQLCGKPFGHTRLPLFWRVRIQRWGVDLGAVSRQTGLTMALGGYAALASVMGPDEDMAEKLSETEITVCEKCAVERSLPVAAIAEAGGDV